MSLNKGKPQKRREDVARPQPRRRRVPRREETIISLTPLPSGLLIKEFTKQNKLIRSAFQPLSGELVPVDDPNDLPEMKDVRPKWRKNFAGALPHQRKLKLHTWIELQAYTTWSISKGPCPPESLGKPLYSYKDRPENFVAIKTKEINRIEIQYSKASNKI